MVASPSHESLTATGTRSITSDEVTDVEMFAMAFCFRHSTSNLKILTIREGANENGEVGRVGGGMWRDETWMSVRRGGLMRSGYS